MKIYLVVLATLFGLTKAIPQMLDLTNTYNYDSKASHKAQTVETTMNKIYFGIEMVQMCSSEHAGTHVEAPITFNNSRWSVDEIPFERLWRVPSVVMDASRFSHAEYKITAERFQAWERETGLTIPDGGVLLIYTSFYPDSKLSIDDDGTESLPPQPRLSEDAGLWLANYSSRHNYTKGIFGVGIDLVSLDGRDQNTNSSARARLFEKDIYALNNLKGLSMLPRTDFLLTVMPMKINGGAGAPARVMAERVEKRPKHDDDDDDDDDDDHKRDWDSEMDHGYPYPKWGHDGMAVMSAGAPRISDSSSLAMVALSVLLALRR